MIKSGSFHFFSTPPLDPFHLLPSLMYQLGKNIALNVNSFHLSKRKLKVKSPTLFKVVSPMTLMGNATLKDFKDLTYKEKYVELSNEELITFPKEYLGYKILGVHTLYPSPKKSFFDFTTMCQSYFSMVFKNQNKKLVKNFRSYSNFDWLYEDFVVDDSTSISYNKTIYL